MVEILIRSKRIQQLTYPNSKADFYWTLVQHVKCLRVGDALAGFLVEYEGAQNTGRALAGRSHARFSLRRFSMPWQSGTCLICGVLIGFALYSKKEEPGIELI